MNKDEQWLLAEKYGGEKTEGFFADVERLKAGEPLAYVIGSIPFLDCTIYLDSHPLIPRPETEFLVERSIAEIKRAAPTAPHILDLCAGSGCIGVAVAKAIPQAEVHFAELDGNHLDTIDMNIVENGIDESKIMIIQSDLFENVLHKYDFILTNPPYIDPALDRTQSSVKNHEPHLALYGGEQGIELITTIITEAKAHLTPNGQLWLEHEPEQVASLIALAQEQGYAISTEVDQYGVERFSVFKPL